MANDMKFKIELSEKDLKEIQKYTDMIDDVYDRIRKRTKPETREKVRNQMIDLTVEQIIDDAFALYCPQVRSEITDLAQFLVENTPLKFGLPIKVLEIGTKFGGTFFIWNKLNEVFAKDREHWSHWDVSDLCISVDFSDGGIHGGISDEEMDKRDLRFHERFENCHFIRGDSHDEETRLELINLISQDCQVHDFGSDVYLNTNYFDFLFIDGDHSYEGVKKDWEMYSKFLAPGAICAFHDIVISDRHHERNVYVGEFWRELTRVKKSDDPNICMIDSEWYEVHEFVEPGNDWAGIGALLKL